MSRLNLMRKMSLKLILAVICAVSLLAAGCSSVYMPNSFTTKDKFYKDFNNFAKSRKLSLTLKSGAALYIDKGAYIKDSLLIYSAENGKGEISLPLNKIKSANYKNRLLGMLYGSVPAFAVGGGLGYAAGFYLSAVTRNSGPPHPRSLYDQHTGIELGGGTFALVGGIIGWIIGNNTSYVFNP